MSDLITRLSEATEGHWDLDAKFLALFGWDVRDGWQQAPGDSVRNAPEEFVLPTQSVADALRFAKPPGHPLWTYTLRGRFDSSPRHDWHMAEITVPSSEFMAYGRTAALALCIASLKARGLS